MNALQDQPRDSISLEFQSRIKAALVRANDSVKKMNLAQLDEASERGFEMANEVR